MEVNKRENPPKLIPFTWEYPFVISRTLYFSTYHTVFLFFMNSHLIPLSFIPFGNVTGSHVLFFLKDSISSSMTLFHILPSTNMIASFTNLGSSSMEDNTKSKLSFGVLYLLGYSFSRPDLLTSKFYYYTSSFESGFSSFISNS